MNGLFEQKYGSLAVLCIGLTAALCLFALCDSADAEGTPVKTIESDHVTYNIYESDDGAYACLKSVDGEKISNQLSIPCFITDPADEETVYEVIGLEENAFDNTETITGLMLPTTLEHIGQNAFQGLFDNAGKQIARVTLPAFFNHSKNIVEIPNKGSVSLDEYMADFYSYMLLGIYFLSEDDITEIACYIGIDDQAELKATNIDIFEEGYYTQTAYKGCVNRIDECLYERSYFESVGWVTADGKSEFAPGDNIEIGADTDSISLYAVWEETGYDYPQWMFDATTALILILIVAGSAYAVVRLAKQRSS